MPREKVPGFPQH